MTRPAMAVVAAGLQRTGVLELTRHLTRSVPRILMYHRFSSDGTAAGFQTHTFEQHVRYLSSRFKLVTMSELAEALRRKRVAPHTAAITVDDGYRDFYQHAYPILQRYGVPATVYVTTGFVDGHLWHWPDQIAYVLTHSSLPRLRTSIGDQPVDYDLMIRSQRARAWNTVADYCFPLPARARDAWLSRFAADLKVTIPARAPVSYEALTWDEARELASAGIEIGSHTYSHARLIQLEPPVLREELASSKVRIEDELDCAVGSFCYPYGAWTDVGPAVRHEVERCGYRNAVLAFPDEGPSNDVFALGRKGAGASMPNFLRFMSGLDFLLSRRRGPA